VVLVLLAPDDTVMTALQWIEEPENPVLLTE
jgi:hypothetical protein